MLILIQLLIAHLLTDFALQPTSWIKHKRKYKVRSYFLIIHAIIAGVLTVLFLQQLEWWYIGLVISITHFLIDWWKLNQKKDNLKYFILDQIFHLLIIVIVWLYLINGYSRILPVLKEIFNSITILTILGSYLFVIFPAGFLIGKATKRWQNEIEETNKKTSLDDAGRYIGIFERILVLTFILTSNFSAIGFLIAAKSILRFSDKSETGARKQTEYVLIGTLISFTITILLGLLVSHFLF
ncbi:uncharacterized protein DUF3307 [Gillisia mitskevichiae]|uniref:Uncharacterized protein DUF3307 n=1 Tax=Gillisia mitskevichiae TaxID=270921 RepID=A0A495PUH9_9FLAO|nr:DUF3307 domain-containing protein [Gillisia mitskevichiae]RKS53212.1 uncharacterized protein DUF3307 [Gillisia mitskevichiae]